MANIPLLEEAAQKLQDLVHEFVFVGGSILDILITDTAAPPLRPTLDVDVIAEITTYIDYAVILGERLHRLGFSEDSREGAPRCRWVHGSLTLDVMPLDGTVLGFTNRWYKGAIEHAVEATLPSGRKIRIISAPFFLGTKMEAFLGRGEKDYFASQDLEDFVAVLDGREELMREVQLAPEELRLYLQDAVKHLFQEPRFLDALPGYFPGDSVSQQRIRLVENRLRALAEMSMDER